MKRQKRDRNERAFDRGYMAGLDGRSQELCPFEGLDHRASWISGWRAGRSDHFDGYRGHTARIARMKI